jgi:hypothetical protein
MMPTNVTEDGTLHLLVTVKDEHMTGMDRLLLVEANAVRVNAEGKIRNPTSGWRRDEFSEFRITGQMDKSSEDFYGRRISFFEHRIELVEAEQIVKTLRRIHRKLERMDEQLGSAPTFAGFVARVALVIEADMPKPFIICTQRGPGYSYDDNEYRYLDADGIAHWLDTQVREWQDKHGFVRQP